MVSETDIQERIDRAVEREVEFSVASSDPLVVQADSEHSDSIHTIVPKSLHCSCPDDTYRGPVCYHQIALMLEDNWLGELIRQVVEESYEEVSEDITVAENTIEGLRDHEIALGTIKHEVVDGDTADERVSDGQSIANQISDMVDEDRHRRNRTEDASDDDSDNAFEEMVSDLSGDDR